ncbi:MAG: response regulator [Planctomycetaceae bacterium]|jgi:signal transduction histidine kinase/CheY-like chemotaxis protein|nr:response regulator [Planctomycetaceae bacterium]
MLTNFNLRTKIFLSVAGIIILSFIVLTWVVSDRTFKLAKDDAFILAETTAERYQQEIRAELQGARITAETLANVFGSLKDIGIADRTVYDTLLRNALAKKEYITAFCVAYELDALDGKDKEFAGKKPQYDNSGRYAPYWNKLGGTIEVEALLDEDITVADWWLEPQKTKQEYITNPYPYKVQGQDVMLESLIFPVIHKGKFIGIVSSDIVLDKLQEMVTKINPHNVGGLTEIFSNDGTVAAHPDKQFLGKNISEIDAERESYAEKVKEKIKNGEHYIHAGKEFYTVYMPIKFSEVTNPWSVAVSIPIKGVLAEANGIRDYVIGTSLFAVLFIGIMLYVVSNHITRPIVKLTDAVRTFGEGNYSEMIPVVDSKDEIGTLSKTFCVMAEKINIHVNEIRDYASQLEAANNIKRTFLRNTSHELRTPLNATVGLSDVLLKTNLDDAQKGYVKEIYLASLSLLGIVSTIIDFTEAESGKMKINRTAMNVRQLLEDTLKEFRVLKTASKVQLKTELDNRVPSSVLGDPLRLKQVLSHLLDNAYKFTEEGTITVCANVSRSDPNNVQLDFSIADTGIGLNPQQADKMFALFNQADNSATRKYGGIGIGLTIAREITRMMGGTISAANNEGGGACFTLSVPFQVPEGGQEITDSETAAGTSDVDLTGLRVLLAEDNKVNVLIAMQLLKRAGADVVVAGDGAEALRILKEIPQPFDAVLMDLQMPVMDGYEATKVIKSLPEYKDIPVIALTAHSFAEERERCRNLGMEEHLSKPIDIPLFYATLRNIAERKQKLAG